MHFLAISGSLRKGSSNTALLQAAAVLTPAGIRVTVYDGLADLPHFNPDLETMEPPSVKDLRARLRETDGLLISSPEYAHGVPGVLKNALDWLVGGEEFVGKPVALLNASPRATHAQASLVEIIATMSGYVVREASITVPLLGKNLDKNGIVLHPEFSSAVRAAIIAFARAVESRAVFQA